MKSEPKTLLEAIEHFADPDVTHEIMVNLRWPTGVHCTTCGRTDVRFISTRRMWECEEKHPRRQFSSKVGTIFEDSPLGLDTWFAGIWMVANCKNGISSYEMVRDLGITQKSAWFLDHRVRLAIKAGSIMKMDGVVEADETFIGGLSKNMHEARPKKAIKGTGGAGKTIVMGIVRRKNKQSPSKAKAVVIKDASNDTLHPIIRENVKPGTALHTDAWAA